MENIYDPRPATYIYPMAISCSDYGGMPPPIIATDLSKIAMTARLGGDAAHTREDAFYCARKIAIMWGCHPHERGAFPEESNANTIMLEPPVREREDAFRCSRKIAIMRGCRPHGRGLFPRKIATTRLCPHELTQSCGDATPRGGGLIPREIATTTRLCGDAPPPIPRPTSGISHN